MVMAFVPPVQILSQLPETETAVETKPRLPVFKPRWWYKDDRLDARPVIWSLDNHPEEWELSSYSEHCIVHKPSQHRFWTDGQGLQGANDCSCTNTRKKFQIGQGTDFFLAVERWQKWNTRGQPSVQEQFAAHFIHD